jgi:hypothetical protein
MLTSLSGGMINRSITCFILVTLLGCTKSNYNSFNTIQDESSIKQITYVESLADFPNPERGFYRHTSTNGKDRLEVAVVKSYREKHRALSADYEIHSTLLLRLFYMGDFVNADISEDYLQLIQDDFNTAREAGVKLIVRFGYTSKQRKGNCPEGFICPPYGDAPKHIVLRHIEQLKPLFLKNDDVIFTIQMGFIGTWGEQYYTDYFGDSSNNGDQKRLLDENWRDRLEVLKALLDATPQSIQIQVRYPQIKQRLVYGIHTKVEDGKPLQESEAFSGTYNARIGHHNDCFLAGDDDYGTYNDYGTTSTVAVSATEVLKEYVKQDSRFVLVGGETCNPEYNPQNDCEPHGRAETEMRDLHYTYLNADYNNRVNNEWIDGGCMASIIRNLGYRLVLRNAQFSSSANNSKLSVTLNLENTGYAAPANHRPVNLVLKNTTTSEVFSVKFKTKIQSWYSGEISFSQVFDLAKLPSGKYELFLHLPDVHNSLSAKSAYAIRLANEELWDETTGYNSLKHVIEI